MNERKEYTLEAVARQERGKEKNRKLRAQGKMPAILYGGDEDPEALAVDEKEFEHLLHEIRGESVLVNLEIDGKGDGIRMLIKEVQRHPVTDRMLHADFYRISETKKLRVEVPVHSEGTPIGVKEGGILETLTRSIEIKALPGKIPQHFSIDISELEVNSSVHISDLSIDPDIEVLTPQDTALFTVVPPKIEEVEEPAEEEEELLAAAEGEIEEPEVIGKGKKEEEEEGAEEEGEAKE